MDSRTRFKCLLDNKRPDRVLRDYWAVPEIDKGLLKHFKLESKDELLDKLDIDFRYVEGPKYLGYPLKEHPDGSKEDLWGVRRKVVHTGEGEFKGSYKSVVSNPLSDCKSVEDILNYEKWPNPDDFDYSVVKEQCEACGDRVVMFMGDRLNRLAQLKPAMYLRGINRILVDMRRKNDKIFVAIRDKITGFYNEYLTRILKAAGNKIDVVVTGDDFGTQTGLFFQPKVWREKLMAGFKKFIQIAGSKGIPVMHHSCGSIHPIIKDMVDCGLRILNPIQPGVYDMNHVELKEEFGANLIFHGGVSLQGPLRFGTPAEVRDEVKKRISELGRNGGYIICTAHNIQADTRLENVLGLFEAYKDFSHYD
ncbi:MAG: uroporphyrinogen decarboxylase family protein [Candidatus Hodarchaeota archaeon]